VADYDKVVPPGKEGKISTKIDSKKLSIGGAFDKKFTVRTNDPANQQFILVVKGTVKKAFEFSRELRWEAFTDDKLNLEVDITNLLPTPVSITGARWANDGKSKGFDQTIGLKVETIEKGKKYRLKLSSTKELPDGNYVANIALATTHPNIKEKPVLVTFAVQRDIELQPERLFLDEMVVGKGAAKPVVRIFAVNLLRGESLRIIKAVPNRDDMKIKIEETRPGKRFRGTVTIQPPHQNGPYLGSVKIFTNHPKYRELMIDVVGSVRLTD